MSVGVPIKILHESEGHTVTLETINGELYRGKLIEAEDNMNVQLCEITFTDRSGKVSQLQNVYIRGSKIRFFILPDMLKNAPMLKKAIGTKGLGTGRGKTTMLCNIYDSFVLLINTINFSKRYRKGQLPSSSITWKRFSLIINNCMINRCIWSCLVRDFSI